MIVGLGHVARVGKDTAANALCRDLGYRRIGFADKLKELAMAVDPLITASTQRVNVQVGHGRLAWTVKGLGWDTTKDTYPEAREILQRLGAGARDIFGENFWIDQALNGVHPEARVVISDVRFKNEAAAIRERGGILIKIDRPGRIAAGHVSEVDLIDFDWDEVIINDGSVHELDVKVVELVRSKLPTVLIPELEVTGPITGSILR